MDSLTVFDNCLMVQGSGKEIGSSEKGVVKITRNFKPKRTFNFSIILKTIKFYAFDSLPYAISLGSARDPTLCNNCPIMQFFVFCLL